MTEFHVEVVRIGAVEKHPNADTLSITYVHGGYPVLFKTGEYKEGDLAVYVPVDSIVPATEEWAWLAPAGSSLRDKDRRIKAKRLRGIFSMGLITKAPEGVHVGQDVAELLGITKYDPDVEVVAQPKPQPKPKRRPGVVGFFKWLVWMFRFYFFKPAGWTKPIAPPKLKYLPGVYDIEPFRKYGRSWFVPGETVIVTEKIHGQNASFVHDGKTLHIKSRTRWRRNDPTEAENTWAKVAQKYGLERKLATKPGIVLFGETYGNNADMAYGVDRQKTGDEFVAFDAWDSNAGRWFDWYEFAALCSELDIPRTPVIGRFEWQDDQYEALLPEAEGKSILAGLKGADHIREGFVIKPVRERRINGGQRVILKMAGESYLTRKAA